MSLRLLWLSALIIAAIGPVALAAEEPPVKVEVNGFYSLSDPSGPTTGRLIALMREDPELQVTEWGGISLPGGAGRSPLMMAIAGRTAPDITPSWFHIIGNDIRQGFLYPLNEWIGEDTNGNGQIDDREAKWDRWKTIPPLWRHVATSQGKVYGIPQPSKTYMGVIFRADMVRAAGLDPNHPPETWDEFIRWCQKLTDPHKDIPGAIIKRGQRGIGLQPFGFTWLPWMQSDGGDPIVQIRRSPTTGQDYTFASDATDFHTSTGEDLVTVEPTWQANFASPAGQAAAGLYHQLRWMKWLIDPESKEPVNLTEADLKNGWVMQDGREIKFTTSDVITGVARGQTGQRGTGVWEMLGRGEVAMVTWFVQDLAGIGGGAGIDPDLLSWFPFPAGPGPGSKRVVQVQQHYAVMCEGVGRRSKRERDRVWEVLTAVTDKRVLDDGIRQSVLSGLARFINPEDLERLGFTDYLKDVPTVIRRNYEEIRTGKIATYTEPFMGFWVTMDAALNQQVLSLIIAETGEKFDYTSALAKVETDANSGIMFRRTEKELNRYRPLARVVFGVLIGLQLFFVVMIVRSLVMQRTATTGQVFEGWLAWIMVIPALLLIGLWGYYPLARGLVMAFQEYKITGHGPFVGLDNFISLALDKSFWQSMSRTVYFVFLNMTLAFLSPIVLAIFLSEVPRGKVFFRTLFFLPQVTSGLVIVLLWKLMYDPTPFGFLNQLFGLLNRLPFIHISSQTWLEDPRLAMICCVVPTVWASMGMASLIYLAALKGVPEEIYEAADMDGAGMFTKLFRITLPTLLPLIIINFVGAFVGTFQNMGNIFLLTFGGPGESTMVVGLRIWIEAYNNLRFSMATAMAWVLAAMLIGFTYIQIRILRRVEFKKAEWD